MCVCMCVCMCACVCVCAYYGIEDKRNGFEHSTDSPSVREQFVTKQASHCFETRIPFYPSTQTVTISFCREALSVWQFVPPSPFHAMFSLFPFLLPRGFFSLLCDTDFSANIQISLRFFFQIVFFESRDKRCCGRCYPDPLSKKVTLIPFLFFFLGMY